MYYEMNLAGKTVKVTTVGLENSFSLRKLRFFSNHPKLNNTLKTKQRGHEPLNCVEILLMPMCSQKKQKSPDCLALFSCNIIM